MIKKLFSFNNGGVRVRFAPSPTGPLHVGGARTALFNYLFARQQKGKFILRIEDTDKERSKLEWIQEIIDEMQWLGISWDEGPDIDGKYGPYKQSQRTDIYKKYLEKLLDEKKAYYCDCQQEELEAKRQDQASRGQSPKYDGKCRDKNKTTGIIRFRVAHKKIKFIDLVRKEMEFDMSLLGDIVIAKNLETPLFHFTVVVDDFEMQISHVIRGEDHISNTPRQILLQEALGFKTPKYAHIPLLLNENKSKLSKRAGDVAVKDYRQQGYLPQAMVNFMALLGWNPGDEREIFSLHELTKEFSLEKVQKGGAVFNIKRLDFINGYYIKHMAPEELVKLCLPYLASFSLEKIAPKTLEKIIALHQPRLKRISEIAGLVDYFFTDELQYDTSLLTWPLPGRGSTVEGKEMKPQDIKKALLLCDTSLRSVQLNWNKEELEKNLVAAAEKFNAEKGYPAQNRGYLLWPLRVALSGKQASAGPFEIAEILGKEKTLSRIKSAIDKLS